MVHSFALGMLPSTPRLFADFWVAKPALRAMVPRHFREPMALAGQAALLDTKTYDRGSLCEVLREQNERFGAGPAALANVARLRNTAALAVVGGQQAGLFGGPLYTMHKALTILAVARNAEKTLARPVVPVFWIASEDSDLAEVDHVFATDREGKLVSLRMPGAAPGKTPVSRIRLGEAIGPLLDELARLLPEDESARETMAELRAAYTAGRTYPQAFGAWMAHLFGPLGLALVDPSDVRLKRLAHGLFDAEIGQKSPVSAAVMEQTARLTAAGYEPQLDLRDGFLTLFHQDPSRDSIRITAHGFELKASGRRFTPGELSALLRSSPESFTPNAAMRPLFQDTLFPTLAVVLGPAETAYFCQLTLAYERLEIPMPVMFPRASLTLVEPKVDRLRVRLGLDIPQLLERGEHVIDDILAKKVPASLARRIADGRQAVTGLWEGIVAEIDSLDPTLHRTALIGSARTLRQFKFMEKKIAQAARKKNVILRGQVARLSAALAPHGDLQERTLCLVPFLARNGRRVLTAAAEAMDPLAPEHRAVVLEP